jgi:hypothetical protein
MKHNLIHFKKIKWDKSKTGIEQKVFSVGNEKLRLIIFRDNFIEKEWCINNHTGYVLDGEMKINFNGELFSFKKGDGLLISEGVQSKHKVIIEKGNYVKLILFETTNKT